MRNEKGKGQQFGRITCSAISKHKRKKKTSQAIVKHISPGIPFNYRRATEHATQSSWTNANFTCVPGKEAKEEPFGSNYESTEKTLLQQPTEHLTEVHTEKYDHNVVVKANPTYLYLS